MSAYSESCDYDNIYCHDEFPDYMNLKELIVDYEERNKQTVISKEVPCTICLCLTICTAIVSYITIYSFNHLLHESYLNSSNYSTINYSHHL